MEGRRDQGVCFLIDKVLVAAMTIAATPVVTAPSRATTNRVVGNCGKRRFWLCGSGFRIADENREFTVHVAVAAMLSAVVPISRSTWVSMNTLHTAASSVVLGKRELRIRLVLDNDEHTRLRTDGASDPDDHGVECLAFANGVRRLPRAPEAQGLGEVVGSPAVLNKGYVLRIKASLTRPQPARKRERPHGSTS